MTGDDDVLWLLITNDGPFGGTLILRMSPEIAEEVRSLLDEQGLTHSAALEFAWGADLVLETVQVLGAAGGAVGGLHGLAAVITAFARRHDGKRVVLSSDGTVEVSGSSLEDAEPFIAQQVRRQAEIEANQNKST